MIDVMIIGQAAANQHHGENEMKEVYSAQVPWEHPKAHNTHLKRIVVEAALSYRVRPSIGLRLRMRQKTVAEEMKEIACKVHHRLHKCYCILSAVGKSSLSECDTERFIPNRHLINPTIAPETKLPRHMPCSPTSSKPTLLRLQASIRVSEPRQPCNSRW